MFYFLNIKGIPNFHSKNHWNEYDFIKKHDFEKKNCRFRSIRLKCALLHITYLVSVVHKTDRNANNTIIKTLLKPNKQQYQKIAQHKKETNFNLINKKL